MCSMKEGFKESYAFMFFGILLNDTIVVTHNLTKFKGI